jgi:hypothetical protein
VGRGNGGYWTRRVEGLIVADPRTTLDAISLPPEEAIAFLRQKANVTSERWTDVWQEAHSRAFMVAGAATEAIVQDFREAVAKAIEQGTTLAEFRRDFDAIVAKHGWVYNGGAGWRSSIIYETNLATAYSAGRYAQMTEPDTLRVYPYWQYMHTTSPHPRPQHLAWVGTMLPASDGWWATHYPPNGWRCKCSVRPVSEAGLRRMGKSGPDTAPPVNMRPWRSRDGRIVTEVPDGIDPGFAYNPGQAWQQHQLPPSAGQPLRPVIPPAEAVVAPAPTIAAPHADELLDALREAAAPIEVGRLAQEVQALLGAETDQVLMSPATTAKQLRVHPELRADEYAQIPRMLAAPAAVGPGRRGLHLVLLRWHERVLYLVVKTTKDRKENWVQSFRRARPGDLVQLAKAGILLGSLDALWPEDR